MASPSRIAPVLPVTDPLALLDVGALRQWESLQATSLPPQELMKRAGRAVADLALAAAPHAQRIHVLAGPDNNGGDGLEAAMHLHRARKSVVVTLVESPHQPPDAAAALRAAIACGLPVSTVAVDASVRQADLVIDALLGIGVTRAPEGPLAHLIDLMNQRTGCCLSIDLPSGLDGDTGQPVEGGRCVRADHTLTLLALKPGLFTGEGRDWSGRVWFDDLRCGSPPVCTARLIGSSTQQFRLPRRHAQHKGSFGDVVVIGGAPAMSGASLLAARAALSVGAGRVYRSHVAGAPSAVSDAWPEIMACTPEDAIERARHAVVVCGCGGGDSIRSAMPSLLSRAPRLILDADALNLVAQDDALADQLKARASRHHQTVITPHPLEAARLLGIDVADVQLDRLRAATALAAAFNCTAILKGSGTIVAAIDQRPVINSSGNAALATPGAGDVLAGWIGGIWAQARQSGFEASCEAVYAHGLRAEQRSPSAWPLRASALL